MKKIDETFIKRHEKKFDLKSFEYQIPNIMLRRSLNEAWFSDTLAWLLDPKTEDNLGVDFINRFVKKVAEKRSGDSRYKRREAFLKYSDHGAGRPVTGKNKMSLKNAAVMREFYLSKYDSKTKKGSAQFGDVALFDLDKGDGIFLLIENKLFTSNHPGQLETYYNLVEDKYSSVETREYVYLTLTGEDPVVYEQEKSKERALKENWICMSWTGDILEILQDAMKKRTTDDFPEDVKRLEALLQWIRDLIDDGKKEDGKFLTEKIIDYAAAALTEHLNRLNAKGDGWSQKNNVKSSIKHSSIPSRVLYVQMLPNLALTVQGKNRSKYYYEKILVPFGANPDQVFHLMYMAARDVYHKHFEDPSLYLNGKRKLYNERLQSEKDLEPLLEFIYKYKYHLQVMLSVSKYIKAAEIVEEVRDSYGDEEADKTLKETNPEMTAGDE